MSKKKFTTFALKEVSKGITDVKELGSWIAKNIPELVGNPTFLKIAERAVNIVKPRASMFQRNTSGGRNTTENSKELTKIIQDEINTIYKNGGDYEDIPRANRNIKKLFVDGLNIVKSKKYYDSIRGVNPEIAENIKKVAPESREVTAATKEALRMIKKNRSKEELAAAKAKQRYTEYYKPGGANDRFLMIKNIMETEFKTINEATSDMLDFTGRKKQPNREYHNHSDIISPNMKNSYWNNNKDTMQKYEPDLFNFIDSEISNKINDTKKYKNITKTRRLRTQYADTPQSKFISNLAANPRIRNFFSDDKNNPNFLHKHHILGKEDAYRLTDDLDKEDIAIGFRSPTNLTTKKRNEKIAEELRKKIYFTMLGKDRAIQKLMNRNKKEFFGTPNSKDIANIQGFSNRIEMLSSTAKDFGVDLAIPDSKGNIKYYGGQYDNVLQLKKSLKDNTVPSSKNKRTLPSYNEVKNLQKGGLLDIEEMLESD